MDRSIFKYTGIKEDFSRVIEERFGDYYRTRNKTIK